MEEELLAFVLNAQHEQGGFCSYLQLGSGRKKDFNCFVTALILLDLKEIKKWYPAHTRLDLAIEKAIQFIEACEDPKQPGAFCFYPFKLNTPRLDIHLQTDLDDSALAWLSLLTFGRRTAIEARTAIEQIFEKNCQSYRTGRMAQWIQPGVFRTWIGLSSNQNPIDCCVNANVISLYAYLQETEKPSYQAAITTINRGVNHTKASSLFKRRLIPYYAHSMELLYAIRRAYQNGAKALKNTLSFLETQEWKDENQKSPFPRERPICCNDWGKPIWISPALQAIRQLRSIYYNSKHPEAQLN